MTADTSVVVAALAAWHERHADAAAAVASVTSLPGHVLLEAFSVLTRLPGGLAVAAGDAARVLDVRFPGTPLTLDAAARRRLPRRLADAGVHGGAAYDGVVALEAQAGDEPLLSLDDRAQITYGRLAVAFEAL